MNIVIVGGASVTWIPVFMKDFCHCHDMENQTLVLHDIDTERLAVTREFCIRVMAETGLHFQVHVEPALDRALANADIVICNVLIGGLATWAKEIELIKGFGIIHPKGMSVGPGGMIMGLKQIPFMLSLARRMEQLCPNAWLLNYANPMQAIMLALQQNTVIKCIGLCHGVNHSIEKYCQWLGVNTADISVRYGGVNHFELILEMRLNGRDLLPELVRIMDTLEPNADYGDLTTKEMYKIFGALPSNHDIHSIEFYPHYLKKGIDLATYHLIYNDVHVRITNADERLASIRRYNRGELTLADLVKPDQTEWLDKIIHALVSNEPLVLPANILNNGCITNLPDDICVSIPTVLQRDGFMGCHVGEIPIGLDMLQAIHGTVQKLIVHAALTGDRSALTKAMTLDPMCYDLTLAERTQMIEGLLHIARDYLPAFA